MPLTDFDRHILERCLARQPGAWNDFVDRYLGLIHHVIHQASHARSTPLDAADVEDIASEIFLEIVDDDYRVLRDFRRESSLPTYLTVVARRVCIKEIVKREREAELIRDSVGRVSENGRDSREGEPILAAEEVARLLDDLPEQEATVVRLYHLKSLNYRQIGKQLGIAENSVGPILARARQALRRSAETRAAT